MVQLSIDERQRRAIITGATLSSQARCPAGIGGVELSRIRRGRVQLTKDNSDDIHETLPGQDLSSGMKLAAKGPLIDRYEAGVAGTGDG